MRAERFAERFALRVDAPPLSLPTGMASMLWHERFAKDPALTWLRVSSEWSLASQAAAA